MSISIATTGTPARPIWWPVAQGLAVVAVVVAALSQHTALLSGAGRLGALSPGLVGAAVVAEVVSFAALAELQRRLLEAGDAHIDRRSLAAVDLASGAMADTLPAGFAFSTVYTYRQITRWGARPAVAVWVLAATGVLCVAGLVVLGAVGAQVGGLGLLSMPLGVLVGAGFAAVAAVLFAGLVWVSGSRARLERVARLVRRLEAPVSRALRRGGDESNDGEMGWPVFDRPDGVALGLGAWAQLIVLAEVNWLADVAVLALAFAAAGEGVPWSGLLLAYALSQVAASIPLLPGSIGVAEGSLAVGLIAAGAHPTGAVAAVLIYRLITFWLLLPVGWGLWVALRRRA